MIFFISCPMCVSYDERRARVCLWTNQRKEGKWKKKSFWPEYFISLTAHGRFRVVPIFFLWWPKRPKYEIEWTQTEAQDRHTQNDSNYTLAASSMNVAHWMRWIDLLVLTYWKCVRWNQNRPVIFHLFEMKTHPTPTHNNLIHYWWIYYFVVYSSATARLCRFSIPQSHFKIPWKKQQLAKCGKHETENICGRFA